MINHVREPFNTSRLAQAAGIAALSDSQFIQNCRDKNAEGIQYLSQEFNRLGLSYFPANGNFIMVDVRTPGGAIFQELLQLGIIVRAGFHNYPQYIRVSVGTPEQNAKFVAALEQVLNKKEAHV